MGIAIYLETLWYPQLDALRILHIGTGDIFSLYAASGSLQRVLLHIGTGDIFNPYAASGSLQRVLCKSYPINTNMIGFRYFSNIFVSVCYR